jgi:hypothetical protein
MSRQSDYIETIERICPAVGKLERRRLDSALADFDKRLAAFSAALDANEEPQREEEGQAERQFIGRPRGAVNVHDDHDPADNIHDDYDSELYRDESYE